MEAIVQHDQVDQLDVEQRNIELALDEKVLVTVVQQVYDIMQTHHVNNMHVQIRNEAHIIQVIQVVIAVVLYAVQIIHHI